MPNRYVATIVEVPGHGIRLDPKEESAVPEQLNEIHLLVLAVAFALGRGGYDHHPEPCCPGRRPPGRLTAPSSVIWAGRPAAALRLGRRRMPTEAARSETKRQTSPSSLP
jgi:hypothetical protein